MRGQSFLSAFGSGSAAPAKLDTTVGFLADRRKATAVSPVGRATNAGYVWTRIFLRGRPSGR